jgi:nitrate reductase gamma subunit
LAKRGIGDFYRKYHSYSPFFCQKFGKISDKFHFIYPIFIVKKYLWQKKCNGIIIKFNLMSIGILFEIGLYSIAFYFIFFIFANKYRVNKVNLFEILPNFWQKRRITGKNLEYHFLAKINF